MDVIVKGGPNIEVGFSTKVIKVGAVDSDGRYPDMSVGFANDLVGRGESVPAEFSFRASGGKSIKDGTAWIKRLKGNSVVWNQKASFNILVDSLGIAEIADIEGGKMITLTQDYTGSADYDIRLAYNGQLIAGHMYCVSMETYSSKGGRVNMDYGGSLTNRGDIPANTWSLVAAIGVAASDKAGFSIYPNFKSIGYLAGDTFGVRNVRVTDLTQMSQSGNEPTTIEEFYARKPIVADEYAYNEGKVIHMTVEGIKSVGDNAWDEEWENGRYAPSTGLPNTDEGIRSKNRIKVLPNEVYWCSAQNDIFAHFYDAEGNLITNVYSGQYNYLPIKGKQFTTPANADTMAIYVVGTTTYNHDIMITLVHSGWKQDTDAGYQPYWQDTLPLPIIRKYFPNGMVGGTDASGNRGGDIIYYDKASKKWYAQTNMLLLNLDMSNVGVQANNIADYTTFLIPADNANQCKTYGAGAMFNNYGLQTDTYYGPRRIYTTWDNKVSISIPSTMASDVGELQALYQQMPLIVYAELAEPIVTELDAEDQNFRDYYNVADFGTEQMLAELPSAPFSADIIYQFNAVDMIREHEIEINELQSIIATMQAQLASLTRNNIEE